jgi:ABC-2 type transport system permease protein
MNTNLWLIRREFWENRAIWMIPAIFGALLILAALFGHVSIPTLSSHTETRDAGGIFLIVVGLMFYSVMAVYAGWYLLDCLYADRKDRSILFWKSLPISDVQTVLSKLAVALVIIPLVYFVAADVTSLIAAFILSVRARQSLGSALWQPDLWLQIQVLWIYTIIVSAIWYLPVVGWLLAVSAWAKRAVILWSVLPALVLYLIERVFFGTHVIAHVLTKRLGGMAPVAYYASKDVFTHDGINATAGEGPGSVWQLIDIRGFFSSPDTWIGAAIGIALIVLAIQLRMRRSEI